MSLINPRFPIQILEHCYSGFGYVSRALHLVHQVHHVKEQVSGRSRANFRSMLTIAS